MDTSDDFPVIDSEKRKKRRVKKMIKNVKKINVIEYIFKKTRSKKNDDEINAKILEIKKDKKDVVISKKKQKKKSRKVSYKKYLKSEHWKNLSYECKKRDEFKCRHCGSRKRLQAHHKTYKNKGNFWKEFDDIITLCVFCHKKVHKLN